MCQAGCEKYRKPLHSGLFSWEGGGRGEGGMTTCIIP